MEIKNIEKKEKSTVQFTAQFSAVEFDNALNSAYRKNRNSIMVPGFRKGKAPRKMVESMYGASVFYEDAVNELYPEAVGAAVGQEKLRVIGRPSIEDMKVEDDKSLTLVFLAGVYPEVELGQYKGLEAVLKKNTVEDIDVDNDIESTRQKSARIETVERAAAFGDTVSIDYEGSIDGVPFEGGKAEKQSLKLGSASFIPGFEAQVVGMNVGEEKDIQVTFPEDYTPELAGKQAVFKIKLHEVRESVLPELDDEFAKDVSEFDTLEEYKASVRERLQKTRDNSAKEAFENALIDKASANMTVEIPDAMIEERAEQMVDEYAYRLSQQGMTLENYVKMFGMTIEDFKNSSKIMAERQVKNELLLEKIADAEGIEISDEEKEAQYKLLAETYGEDAEKLKTSVPEQYVLDAAKGEKAKKLIFDTAVALDKEPEAEKPEAAEAPAEEAKDAE